MYHATSDGCCRVVAHRRRVALACQQWQSRGEGVEGAEPHLRSRRDVAAEVLSRGGDEVVGDTRADVDDHNVVATMERPRADDGGEAVGTEGERCGIAVTPGTS